ncbi:MAG TPA: hypothetical protein VL022_01760 [Moheibacter sp.]|nr:hypothetical protein [Moheibacter sp.]
MQDVDTLFLEVSKAIDEQNLAEAKTLLEEILTIDPAYGRAHNHLGWIYETKIKDFERAKMHYEFALKFCQDTYPVVYLNYGYLLLEHGQLDAAEKIIAKGLTVQGVDRSTLYYQKGKVAEQRMQLNRALDYYQQAYRMNVSKDLESLLSIEINRVKSKLSFWEKMKIKLGIF